MGDREKVIAVIELRNECGLTQMDAWEDAEMWMGTIYILEAETNRLGNALSMRDERKIGINNHSRVFGLGQMMGVIWESVWEEQV